MEGTSSEEGEAFWVNVRQRLESGQASANPVDKHIVYALAGGQKARGWMSMIPIGLVSSYRYLYDCVKGLGCEDADIIERDVLRTVGAVKDGPGVFGDTSDLGKAGKARAMHRVLTAISITDSMGYCQGMNYVVDFLLKMVNEEDAFCLFLYALRNKHLCCLYETKLPVLSDFMEIYEMQLTHRLPDLAQHLKEHGFIAPFYSIEWFTTLFMLSCPFELTVAIWDLFFMGFKDVQIRCAVALMESIEPSLMMMGTEELLKNFRTVAIYKVDALDVIVRAMRLDLVPVKVGCPDLYSSPTPNGVNQENHNYNNSDSFSSSSSAQNSHSFLIDPRGKVLDDSSSDSVEPGATSQSSGSNLQGDILLTLRLRYLRKAREAMQERDVTTGRWAQEQLQRGHELLQQQYQLQQQQQQNGDEKVNEEGAGHLSFGQEEVSSCREDSMSTLDRKGITPRSLSEEVSDDIAEALQRRSSSSLNSAASPVQGSCLGSVTVMQKQSEQNEELEGVAEERNKRDPETETEGNKEYKKGFTVNNYFEFLVDGELMSKAYALKEVVSSCDRITQWVHLNQKWADCLECMENKLSQYNMADHMLRYAITINAHIRVISFFLAVAGADPNSQDRWLRTPLHFAAVHNRPDVVRVLLLAGADSSIPGALNKSLLIAPTSSPISGALKSGRMVTPTVLCQATYGNSMASYPAALSILKGKACILCNTLEATSLASVAKRRHSRILTGRLIPNMQVQASVRTGESSSTPTTDTPSSPSPSGKVVISNCPRCNIPMCAWCLPDHHCIYEIIQEEFTWKVNLIKKAATSTASVNSDTSSVTSSSPSVSGSGLKSIGVAEGNAKSSKKGSRALRQLGKKLLLRRPSFFGKSANEKEVIRRLAEEGGSDDFEDSESDVSVSSSSTASGELVSPEGDDHNDDKDDDNNNDNNGNCNAGKEQEDADSILERHRSVDLIDVITEAENDDTNLDISYANASGVNGTRESDSEDSGFEAIQGNAPIPAVMSALQIKVASEQQGMCKDKTPPTGGVRQSPKILFNSMFRSNSNSNNSSRNSSPMPGRIPKVKNKDKNNNEDNVTKKGIDFTGGLKKMKERIRTKRNSGVIDGEAVEGGAREQEDFQLPRGGMPMYWIGYRDEANRQATLQPWQIILLPLVQGGEYNRVLQRSGGNGSCGSPAERESTSKLNSKVNSTPKRTSQPLLQVGPDSDDDSDVSLDEEGGLHRRDIVSGLKIGTKGHDSFDKEGLEEDEFRVCDEDIHQQVREIYANSLRYPSKNSQSTFIKRKEPKYLYFVSEMEGLYRTLGRDATEIFSIEPLPPPPPMITSVTASYLHVKHHKHHKHKRTHTHAHDDRDSSSSSKVSDRASSGRMRGSSSSSRAEHSLQQQQQHDDYDTWDGALQPDAHVWTDASSSSLAQQQRPITSIQESCSDPPAEVEVVPAFRSITAFSAPGSRPGAAITGSKSAKHHHRHRHHELELTDKELGQQKTVEEEAEAKYQQQLQIKGINGLKKDALKRFLSGSWKLSEEDDLWVPDEDAWYCRKCSEQFSLFKRKHHCRRCGNVFCDEDAPRVDASECLHESLQQAFQGVMQEEYGGKKKEKVQFRLCMSCKNEVRHSVGLFIELDFLLPRYNFSTWLISLLSKTYDDMCQSAPHSVADLTQSSGGSGGKLHRKGGCDANAELKNVRLKKFAVAGHWMDSMADWLWRDRQLQLDST